MNPKKTNAASVTDYRVGELEKQMIETRKDVIRLHGEHESRLRTIEDFVTRENAGGVPLKIVWLIAGVVATIIGGILTAVFKAAGIV